MLWFHVFIGAALGAGVVLSLAREEYKMTAFICWSYNRKCRNANCGASKMTITDKPKLTNDQYDKLGQSCRDAMDGNILVSAFAAELVGESYPFSKKMAEVVFRSYTNIELGMRFEKWIRESGQ